MTRRRVFYSFHYENDVFRVQQIRNIGALESNSPAQPNQWEEVKRSGDTAIQRWIDNSMSNTSCVVVLIGSDTANRKWINYEIKKAWNDGKGLFGIYIQNLKDPRTGKCSRGKNPFDSFTIGDKPMSEYVRTYDPNQNDPYNDIANQIENWIECAIADRNR
ncbi:MAG: TIR domain-containing protein [Myxococcales bacterium]|nr:TIR domain-containing protein [Myxococcales bacterium]